MSNDNELQKALDVISNHKKELELSTERSVVVCFDLDDNTSYHRFFKTEAEFFKKFKDTEIDCEGFSWTLWNDGYIFEFNTMYHLIKLGV